MPPSCTLVRPLTSISASPDALHLHGLGPRRAVEPRRLSGGGKGQGLGRCVRVPRPRPGADRGDVPGRLARPQGRRHRAGRHVPRVAAMVGPPRRRRAHGGGGAAARAAARRAAGFGARPALRRGRDRHRHGRERPGGAGPPARPRRRALRRPALPARRQSLGAVGAGARPRPAEPLVRRGVGLRGGGARARRAGAASLARRALPRQRGARPVARGDGVVRSRPAGALRRDPRGRADDGGRDLADARGPPVSAVADTGHEKTTTS